MLDWYNYQTRFLKEFFMIYNWIFSIIIVPLTMGPQTLLRHIRVAEVQVTGMEKVAATTTGPQVIQPSLTTWIGRMRPPPRRGLAPTTIRVEDVPEEELLDPTGTAGWRCNLWDNFSPLLLPYILIFFCDKLLNNLHFDKLILFVQKDSCQKKATKKETKNWEEHEIPSVPEFLGCNIH